MAEIFLIDGEYKAADTGHGFKFLSRSNAPILTVMACSVEAALPRPAGAGQAVDTFKERDAASK